MWIRTDTINFKINFPHEKGSNLLYYSRLKKRKLKVEAVLNYWLYVLAFVNTNFKYFTLVIDITFHNLLQTQF